MRDETSHLPGWPRRFEHAFIDEQGGCHLPIHDSAHIRASVQRFSETRFPNDEAREEARRRILRAAGRYGIEVSKESGVRRREPNRRRP